MSDKPQPRFVFEEQATKIAKHRDLGIEFSTKVSARDVFDVMTPTQKIVASTISATGLTLGVAGIVAMCGAFDDFVSEVSSKTTDIKTMATPTASETPTIEETANDHGLTLDALSQ